MIHYRKLHRWNFTKVLCAKNITPLEEIQLVRKELNIVSLANVETEVVEWLWAPYIPCGKITIFQGEWGCGKTMVSTAIAADITTGTPLPGGSRTTPGNVIVQTAEDGLADTIKPRLEQLGADCSRVFSIDEEDRPLTFMDERVEQAIIKYDAKLLLFDPIQAYIGDANMNSAGSMRPLMKHLAGVAARTDCAIVILGHLNKSARTAQHRGLGSTDIPAAARSVLTFGKISGSDLCAIVHSKSNLAPSGPSLSYTLDPVNGFQWCGEYDITLEELLDTKKQRPENKLATAQRFITTTLENGPVPAEVMEQTAKNQYIAPKTLRRAKADLGVRSMKRNNIWYWELLDPANLEPPHEVQDGQGGHVDDMTILATLPNLRPAS